MQPPPTRNDVAQPLDNGCRILRGCALPLNNVRIYPRPRRTCNRGRTLYDAANPPGSASFGSECMHIHSARRAAH
eukprot:2990126-Pyramimonas_sp.AAC.1